MRAALGLICLGLLSAVLAQERRIDIDPNTKIEGGADVRRSGTNAGAGEDRDQKVEDQNITRPDKSERQDEKPISERKPQERDREEAAKDAAKPTLE